MPRQPRYFIKGISQHVIQPGVLVPAPGVEPLICTLARESPAPKATVILPLPGDLGDGVKSKGPRAGPLDLVPAPGVEPGTY